MANLTAPSQGSIIIAHAATDAREVHREARLRSALEPNQSCEIVRIEPDRRPLADFDESYGWVAAARRQCEQLHERLGATRTRYPEYSLTYCGFVPVPLAFHLGVCLGQTVDLEIRLLQHFENHWRWPSLELSSELEIQSSLRGNASSLSADVPICVSTSAAIHDADIAGALPEIHEPGLGLRVSLSDPRPRERLRSADDLEAVASRFYDLMCELGSRGRPRLRHLFAAVPVGLAFRMGTMLNPTMDLPIQTWKWRSDSRRYVPALRIEARRAGEVLILAASPPQLEPLSTSLETQELRHILHCRNVRSYALDEVDSMGLVRALSERRPLALHLSGHGRAAARKVPGSWRNLEPPRPIASALAIVGAEQYQTITADELRDLLPHPPPRLIVLSCCHGEQFVEVLREEIECIVVFRGRVDDGYARMFSLAFWRALADGFCVHQAFLVGRQQLPESEREGERAQLLFRRGVDPAKVILFPQHERS